LCAGVGECRKKLEGSMCPSYMATRDEQHCTRGRANALRLALTGQAGLQGLTDPALFEVLDLCLECKACKSECPTNVDMARLKAEFLHQYYKKHGLPWRNRLFGNVATIGEWGCRLAPVSNWIAASSFGRWLNEVLLGIDRRRIPPAFARQECTPYTPYGALDENGQPPPHVLIFPDTFISYHEPDIGDVTVKLIQRLCHVPIVGKHGRSGVATQIHVPHPSELRCCGRPLISNGLLPQAVKLAQQNVARLHPWAICSGSPIISCEPSCILTIKDDYPALLQGEDRRKAEKVAAVCQSIEEYLEKTLSNGMRQPSAHPVKFKPGPKQILVQGHCHQRSLVGMDATLKLLRRIPGAEVIDLDAGCCGMAGSFGYEKEHYEISRLVGEQRLFPALRKAPADAVVVAPGFSCRMQIKHFTGRIALHPAQLLHSLLETTTPS
jgi:Fe-S oxidoreductase